ncbi:glycosyltransferase [Planctomycetota bacterium]|nr:glycosyltransferase [Planctomycetota bacterium]
MNTQLPRISVITPSYNQADFLERTIKSVLDQNYPNLQYGIVDGGSTDGSAAIIHKYQDKLDFSIIESDRGQVDAINKGLRIANGDILCYLNSDDTLLPGTLFAVANYFIENSDCEWLIGNCVEIDAEDKPLRRLKSTPVNSLSHAIIREHRLEVPQPAIFWRKELTDKYGLFNESYNFAFDYDLWCRFLSYGHKLQKIDVDLATYRLHNQSKTCSLQLGFLENHQRIEASHAKHLKFADRLKFARFYGYRRRQYELLQVNGRPWRQVLKHPWWIASKQVRSRLLSSTAKAA